MKRLRIRNIFLLLLLALFQLSLFAENTHEFFPIEDCLDFTNLYGDNISLSYQNGRAEYLANQEPVKQGKSSFISAITTRGTDRYIPSMQTIPDGFNSSVLLGSHTSFFASSRATYTYTVPSDASTILLFNYAIVLYLPRMNHATNQMPRFTLKITDVNGNSLDNCLDVNFVPNSFPAPNWQSIKYTGSQSATDSLYYRDWTSVGIDLRPYAGQTINIEITKYDCTHGAHWLYAYYTLGCMPCKLQVNTCYGDQAVDYASTTITAPYGFTYKWFQKGDYDHILGQNQNFVIPLAIEDTFVCRLGSKFENPCSDIDLQTYAQRLKIEPFADIVVCADSIIGTSRTYVQSFGPDGVGVPIDENIELTWKIDEEEVDNQYIHPDENGNKGLYMVIPEEKDGKRYHIQLAATIMNGKCEAVWDTIVKVQKYFPDSLNLCVNDLPYTWKGTLSDDRQIVFDSLNGTFVPTENDTLCIVELPVGKIHGNKQFRFSYKNADGCDSIVPLSVFVNQQYHYYDTVHTCECDPESYIWEWEGEKYDIPFIRGERDSIFELQTQSGCDSIIELHLIADSCYERFFEASHCSTIFNHDEYFEGIQHNGYTFDREHMSGEYIFTEKSRFGCDSIIHINLSVWAEQPSIVSYDTTCAKQLPYITEDNELLIQDYEEVRWTDGNYMTTLISQTKEHECDSITELYVYVYEYDPVSEHIDLNTDDLPYSYHREYEKYRTLANGQLYSWVETIDTVFRDTIEIDTFYLKRQNVESEKWGCEIIDTLIIEMKRAYHDTIDLVLCDQDLEAESITQEERRKFGITNSWGYHWRDTIFTLNIIDGVTLTPFAQSPTPKPIFYHEFDFQRKSRFDTDSTTLLRLTVTPSYEVKDTITFCSSELQPGKEWSSGRYRELFRANIGGFPNDTLMVTETSVPTIKDVNKFIGLYTYKYGCDSIVHLTCRVLPTMKEVVDISLTSDQLMPSYAWRDREWTAEDLNIPIVNGVPTGSVDTILKYTMSNIYGCDSVVYAHIVVLPVYNIDIFDTICDTEIQGNQYIWGEDIITFTEEQLNGITPYAPDYRELKTLEGITFHKQSQQGTDSIVTLHLTITPSYSQTEQLALASGELPYNWNGNIITAESLGIPVIDGVPFGSVNTTIDFNPHTQAGCDSIIHLNLSVTAAHLTRDTVRLCDKDLELGYPYHLPEGDTIFTLSLPTREITTEHSTPTQPFDTVFRFSRKDMAGNDSIIELLFIVNPTYKEIIYDTICSTALPYEWRDTIFDIGTMGFTQRMTNYSPKQTGQYVFNKLTTAGCDSVVTLHLTILPAYEQTFTETINESQLPHTWSGMVYNISDSLQVTDNQPTTNTYLYTYTLKEGCDSIVHYVLTVRPALHNQETLTLTDKDLAGEDGYAWRDTTFTLTLPTRTLTTDHEEDYVQPFDTVFRFHGTAVDGSDSIMELHLIVNPSYHQKPQYTICSSQLPYIEHGETFAVGTMGFLQYSETPHQETQTTTFYYSDGKTTAGADSIVDITLTIHPAYELFITENICADELPHEWSGMLYNESDSLQLIENQVSTSNYLYRHKTQNGCDSIVHYTLIVNPTYLNEVEQTFCASQLPISWGFTEGQVDTVLRVGDVWSQGALIDTIRDWRYQEPWVNTFEFNNLSQAGCDSTVRFTATIYPYYDQHETMTIASGELPLEWRDHIITAADLNISVNEDGLATGSYEGTLTFKTNTVDQMCDSTVHLHLTVKPSYLNKETLSLCDKELDGDGYTWRDTTFTLTLPTRTLTVDNQHFTQPFDTTFRFERTSIDGTDSVVNLRLIVYPTYLQHETVIICDADLAGEGFAYSHTGAATPDTIFTTTLTTWEGIETLIPVGDANYREAWEGDFRFERQTTNGHACDSIVWLHLKVLPTYIQHETIDFCSAELPYTWNDTTIQIGEEWDGRTLQLIVNDTVTVEPWQHTLDIHRTTAAGCDSIIYLHTTIYPTYQQIIRDTICDTELLGEGYHWRDTIFTPHLTARNMPDTTLSVGDATPRTAWVGEFLFSKKTEAHGCDSIVTLQLVVNPTYNQTEELRIGTCSLPYTWRDQVFNKTDFGPISDEGYETTLVFNRQTEGAGCDSIVTLQLGVFPCYEMHFTHEICSGQLPFRWYHHTFGADTTHTGLYEWHLKTVAGFDSIVTLQLNVLESFEDMHIATICEDELPYTFRDTTFEVGTESGVYLIEHLYSLGGCDSLVMLNLTVSPTYHSVVDVEICDCQLPYQWRDTLFMASTTPWGDSHYTFHRQSVNGCDSIVELNLRVNSSKREYENAVICSNELPFAWRDTLFMPGTVTGSYVFNRKTSWNCDSIVTLNLIVHPAITERVSVHLCQAGQPFTFRDTVFGAGTPNGDYYFYRQTVNGCDSTVILSLRTDEPYTIEIYDTTYVDSAYHKYNFHYPATTYPHDVPPMTQELLSSWGCDSIVTLYLTILPRPFEIEEPWLEINEICAGDRTFDIVFKYEVNTHKPDSVLVQFDSLPSALGFDDVLTTYPDFTTITVPVDVRPDIYACTIYFMAGRYRKSLRCAFMVRYPASVIHQKWNNVLALKDSTTNGGYNFEYFQWYANNLIMPLETNSFIYLGPNESFDFQTEYTVAIKRRGENYDILTCPYLPTPHHDITNYPTLLRRGEIFRIRALNTDSNTNEPCWFEMIDATGRTAIRQQLDIHDLNNLYAPLSAGLYITRISQGQEIITYKVIVR